MQYKKKPSSPITSVKDTVLGSLQNGKSVNFDIGELLGSYSTKEKLVGICDITKKGIWRILLPFEFNGNDYYTVVHSLNIKKYFSVKFLGKNAMQDLIQVLHNNDSFNGSNDYLFNLEDNKIEFGGDTVNVNNRDGYIVLDYTKNNEVAGTFSANDVTTCDIDFSALGQLCIDYTIPNSNPCNTVTPEIKLIHVLLAHEKAICDNATAISNINTSLNLEGIDYKCLFEGLNAEQLSTKTLNDVLQEIINKICSCNCDDDKPTPNLPPTSVSGNDVTTANTTVALVGSQSYDSDGTISTYLWSKPIGVVTTSIITSPNSANTSITGLEEGVHIFNLLVTDNDGATNSSSVTVTVTEQPVSTALEISSDLCGSSWANNSIVYANALPSELPDVIQNGVVLYSNSLLTIPFDGGGKHYRFRGVQPLQQLPDRIFAVSTVGSVSDFSLCGLLTTQDSFNYNGNDTSQGNSTPNASVFQLTTALITSMYTGSNPISHIRVITYPTIGDLGGQTFRLDISMNPLNEISLNDIQQGYFAFWCRGLIDQTGNELLNNGSFTDTFTYVIVDSLGNDIDTVQLTLNATNVPI